MTTAPRQPPPQFVFRLKRALGGRAGWGGLALQVLFAALLFQLLFWYLAVLGALPGPRQSIALFGSFLSNRGLVIPRLIPEAGLVPFVVALVAALVIAFGLRYFTRRLLFEKGRAVTIWP